MIRKALTIALIAFAAHGDVCGSPRVITTKSATTTTASC